MMFRRMRDKPIAKSQGPLGSLSVAVPSPMVGGGGEGTVQHGTLPELLYQSQLEVGDQVTGHTWLIDSTFQ